MNKSSRERHTIKKAARCAFPHTIPILTGFLFLGMTYGIYMNASGFSFWYPMLMSLTIFAGSIEFVTVNLLLGAFHPVQALAMALMINARHLFYGISMLEKYQGAGLKKFYLIFGMCDESFSINYAAEIPEDVDRSWFMFFCNPVQSHLLGNRRHSGRHLRLSDSLQYRGTGFCHDSHVCCNLYGTMDEGKEPYLFYSWAFAFSYLPDYFRSGPFHHSRHADAPCHADLSPGASDQRR